MNNGVYHYKKNSDFNKNKFKRSKKIGTKKNHCHHWWKQNWEKKGWQKISRAWYEYYWRGKGWIKCEKPVNK